MTLRDDPIRPLSELLDMLKEAAETNGYFEIGPGESKLLWDHIQQDEIHAAARAVIHMTHADHEEHHQALKRLEAAIS